MENLHIITELYASLMKRPEIRALIPMGYTPGLPMLTIKNDELVAIVPFLRYKVTGKVDQTIVFPIRYVVEYVLPELTVSRFVDLSKTATYSTMDFDKGIGLFRHEAIKNLDKNGYMELRKSIFAGLDKVAAALLYDQPYTEAEDSALKANLMKAVEPSLLGFYKTLDTDFYVKYLKP